MQLAKKAPKRTRRHQRSRRNRKSRAPCRRSRASTRGRVDAGASVGRRGRDGLRGRVDDRQGGQHHLQSGGAQEGRGGSDARRGEEAPRGQGVGGAGGAGRRGPAPVARGLRPRQGQGRSRRRGESFRVDGVDEQREGKLSGKEKKLLKRSSQRSGGGRAGPRVRRRRHAHGGRAAWRASR